MRTKVCICFSSRRRHTRCSRDWSSDVCSSDLYYLEGAGGFSYRAEKSKVSVRYANGEVRTRRRSIFGASDPKPGPGSEVFVPARDSTERTNYVALVGAVAQILASTVAIIVGLRRWLPGP